jgi:hypothetical protein
VRWVLGVKHMLELPPELVLRRGMNEPTGIAQP